jgi:uncharacterized protein (TIGR00251 family)
LTPHELELAETAAGTRLRLKVKAGARRRGALGVHAGALKLAVTTAPERGKANRSVLKLLAELLRVPPSELELVSGETSSEKTVFVPLSAAAVRERLQPFIGT